VVEAEPNTTLATAQNIDADFSLDANTEIDNSTTVPHVTVQGLPGDGTYDYFSFTVGAANTLGDFDMDHAMYGFDSWLDLFDSSGNWLAANDDGGVDPGSVHPYDAHLFYTFANPGTYVIRVGDYYAAPQYGGNGYDLQVSIGGHPLAAGGVPEPASWALMIAGFGGAGAMLRRSRKAWAAVA
jgi:hypothetical protein